MDETRSAGRPASRGSSTANGSASPRRAWRCSIRTYCANVGAGPPVARATSPPTRASQSALRLRGRPASRARPSGAAGAAPRRPRAARRAIPEPPQLSSTRQARVSPARTLVVSSPTTSSAFAAREPRERRVPTGRRSGRRRSPRSATRSAAAGTKCAHTRRGQQRPRDGGAQRRAVDVRVAAHRPQRRPDEDLVGDHRRDRVAGQREQRHPRAAGRRAHRGARGRCESSVTRTVPNPWRSPGVIATWSKRTVPSGASTSVTVSHGPAR